MRKHFVFWGAALIAIPLTAFNTRADLEVSGSVQIHATAEFNAPLAAHGTWVEVGSYGRCWRPARVAVGWRPYCAGEWVWTDCGWYWASDEPWGWACYHYGSWAYDPGSGWVWVPGVQWAPAWVSWRVGGGYIGWAPLPPPGLVFKHRPDPGHFVFVGEAHFGGPVITANLVFKDTHVFAKTSEVGGLKRESRSLAGSSQKVMVNTGPAPDVVRKASGKTLAAVPIHEAVRRSAPPKQVAQASKTQSAASRDDKASGNRSDQGKETDRNLDRGSGGSQGQDDFKSANDRPTRSAKPSGGSGRGGGRGGGGHGKR